MGKDKRSTQLIKKEIKDIDAELNGIDSSINELTKAISASKTRKMILKRDKAELEDDEKKIK